MTEYNKPLPAPTVETLPFWEYSKKHELRLEIGSMIPVLYTDEP